MVVGKRRGPAGPREVGKVLAIAIYPGLRKNIKKYERSQYVIENKCRQTVIVGTKLRSY